jgi:alkylation response protein AidB-like acyl-CoA dehydrogenase
MGDKKLSPLTHFPTTPYSEPLLPQLAIPNPYYTSTHHALRAWVRNYVDTHIAPYAQEWEEAGEIPPHVYKTHCEHGFAIVHPLTAPEESANLTLPGGVKREEWDTWCGLIVADELNRLGFVGVIWGLGGGNSIGCPPIARFGTAEQRRRWLPKVARGEIRFCLGITEPDGTFLFFLYRSVVFDRWMRADSVTADSWLGRREYPHHRGPPR